MYLTRPCVAPPLGPAVLDRHVALDWDERTRPKIDYLAGIIRRHHEGPQRTQPVVGDGTQQVQSLDPVVWAAIEGVLPTREEADVISACFDWTTGTKRDAAYHLLWYVRELMLGREPLTQDML